MLLMFGLLARGQGVMLRINFINIASEILIPIRPSFGCGKLNPPQAQILLLVVVV